MHGNDLCALAMYCVLYPEDQEALSLVHEFMERLAAQPSWEYANMASDDMPISHSLLGMATAYDFLYPTLSIVQRKTYFARIRRATERQFERFKRSSWGRIHLHNHVWNNNVALLVGAVVTSVHDPTAEDWVYYVVRHLNISMNLFNVVVDGSCGEGVSYSTYTTRSMTMFAHIMDRRFQAQQYYQSHWLKSYFWFMYRTLIGYKETVGIADSNPTWFYGPEAMLVFLDKFVLRNGYGNWLAARIRENRSKDRPFSNILVPSLSQRWSTYHLEFIWYDETLGEVSPDPDGIPALTLFSDWGVVTYGGGLPANNTFFSFKSGYVHGRAINRIANKGGVYQEYVSHWASFNPGHEHPDQLSFTFWPHGQPFITESYYGPKFSFLNNVLMFGPSSHARCFPPFEGQVGECFQWLDYMSPLMQYASADIVGSYKQGQYAFVSGEAARAYDGRLKLYSVYRSVVLLTPDVLVVIDHIELFLRSKLTRANAFFNMRQGLLELEGGPSGQRAVLKHSGLEFRAAWEVASGAQTTAYATGYEFPCEFRTRETLVLNVSVDLQHDAQPTRMAYIFYQGNSHRANVHFTASTTDGYAVDVTVDGVSYQVRVPTRHGDPQARMNYLGHPGFASLSSSRGEEIRFGYRSTDHSPVLPTVLISSMPWSGAELIAGALNRSTDFAVYSLTGLELASGNGKHLSVDDMCDWRPGAGLSLPTWLYYLYANQYTSLSKLHLKYLTFPSRPNARVVILSHYGHMDSKLALLPRNPSTKLVHVLRDPRSWVAYVLKTSGKLSSFIKNLNTNLVKKPSPCLPKANSPLQQRLRAQLDSYKEGKASIVELLALYWVSHALPVLTFKQEASDQLLIVWLEDLVVHPESEGERIVEGFLGLPLSPASRHYLLQLTRSEAYTLWSTGEIVNQRKIQSWKTILTPQEIQMVENTVSEFVNIK